MKKNSILIAQYIQHCNINRYFEEVLKNKIDPELLFKILANYIYFNNAFGTATLNLIQKSNQCVDFLNDFSQPAKFLENRTNEVMSYIFSAQKDEYSYANSHITHKMLAETTFKSVAKFLNFDSKKIEKLAVISPNTASVSKNIYQLLDINVASLQESYFRAIGFNLAQEFSADREYFILSNFFKKYYSKLYKHLENDITIKDEIEYSAATWISIHTTIESKHAQDSLYLVELITKYYTGEKTQDEILLLLQEGVDSFKNILNKFSISSLA